ncbi:MAG TPA: LysM peptidoglycan-binding domain-containing protein [Anaerolineaceae bacterium]|jgi:LysM repeat protein|nr:LysM peptidoglycan-binding domain-containing protein [Anaerolineaceae bacterium]HPS33251.1 LysM peptidoglycan-binding domain-containing protein [Anaerolineaceae bacterium]
MRKQFRFLALLLIAGLVGGTFLALPANRLALAADSSAQAGQEAATATPGVPGFITSTPGADGSIKHIVRSGEFLITIAQAYGISLDELLALNNLTAESILQVDQELIIRKATNPLPALTSGTVIAPTATLRPSLTPQPSRTPALTAVPTPTPTRGPGVFTRVFSGRAAYVGIGIVVLILLGAALLIISSRRIH